MSYYTGYDIGHMYYDDDLSSAPQDDKEACRAAEPRLRIEGRVC